MQPVASLLLSFAALAAAAPANSGRAVETSDSDPFQIYAYGTGMGGLAMFTSGGDAYFGDHTRMNDSDAAPVILTPSTDKVWTGAPNTTGISNSTTVPSWSNITFYIPTTGSSEHSVGFLSSNSSTSDRQTSGFTFYGSFVFVQGSDSAMESLWYALPSSVDGVYSLKWNETGDSTDGKISLTLKKTPPSNPEAADADVAAGTTSS